MTIERAMELISIKKAIYDSSEAINKFGFIEYLDGLADGIEDKDIKIYVRDIRALYRDEAFESYRQKQTEEYEKNHEQAKVFFADFFKDESSDK